MSAYQDRVNAVGHRNTELTMRPHNTEWTVVADRSVTTYKIREDAEAFANKTRDAYILAPLWITRASIREDSPAKKPQGSPNAVRPR